MEHIEIASIRTLLISGQVRDRLCKIIRQRKHCWQGKKPHTKWTWSFGMEAAVQQKPDDLGHEHEKYLRRWTPPLTAARPADALSVARTSGPNPARP